MPEYPTSRPSFLCLVKESVGGGDQGEDRLIRTETYE
jgi:hypothetical protein